MLTIDISHAALTAQDLAVFLPYGDPSTFAAFPLHEYFGNFEVDCHTSLPFLPQLRGYGLMYTYRRQIVYQYLKANLWLLEGKTFVNVSMFGKMYDIKF